MTTKPKARKFRIRKTGGASTTAPEDNGAKSTDAAGAAPGAADTQTAHADPTMPEPAATEDGFSNTPFPGSAAFDKLQADAQSVSESAAKTDAPKATDTATAEEPNAGMPTAEQELAAIRAEG
jgi:hypothetical protein